MPELLLAAALCCALMTAALVRMLRPRSPGEAVMRACVTAAGAAAVSVVAGTLTEADTAAFFLASSFAAAPVSVLLGAAAEEARPGRRGVAWALALVWGVLVFPVCAVIPPLVFGLCEASECRVEDFGGGLALLVSSAASVLLAWRAPADHARESWTRFALPVLVIWVAGAFWLGSLEGVIDVYTARILLAALVAPVGGAAAWMLVDVLRRAERHPLRSAADGVLAGLVAIVPGAAGISFPWSLAVGALAGAVAALVYGLRRLSSAGRAGHWALVVLASTAVGYLAPAVSGDSIGLLFSGRIAALLPPMLAILAVAAIGVLVTAPIWAIGRRGSSAL
jgi:ammonia channel protein AmtB